MKTNELKEIGLDQLGVVSGGTVQEFAELKEAIFANPALAKEWERATHFCSDDDECCLEVICNIFDIAAGGGFDIPNNYEYGEYTHNQIIEMIRNYR